MKTKEVQVDTKIKELEEKLIVKKQRITTAKDNKIVKIDKKEIFGTYLKYEIFI